MDALTKYEAILFDVGNTLVVQAHGATPFAELAVELLPGVRELLDALRPGFRLGAVSNSNTLDADRIRLKLREVDLDAHFETVVSSLDLGVAKPSPIPLLRALEAMCVEPSAALYVGDLDTDRRAAAAAGMDFLYTARDIREAFEDFRLAPHSAWARARTAAVRFSQARAAETRALLDSRVKPQGSLGRLEELAITIAGIAGTAPRVDPAAAAIFVGDHGIAAGNDVTPWPQAISASMADVIVEGEAGVSVLARQADTYLEVVDVGTVQRPRAVGVYDARVAAGTRDFRFAPAMRRPELDAALEAGAATAERLVAGGSRALATGEVGIGNTTAAAILIAHFTGARAAEATGRGAGIPDDILVAKRAIVAAQLAALASIDDPLEVLARCGGLEIAALVGFITRAASLRVPVVLDGVTTLAAALVAVRLRPDIACALIAGHVSTEPAARIALSQLGLRAILDLDLRLGEGSGAVLALPILRAACGIAAEMGSLDSLLRRLG
jgi:nicotinate-nucleotide--dimethylbenzimidazole phosphoribosyltransferase